MKTFKTLVASILLLGGTSTAAFCQSISATTNVTQPSCSNSNDGQASVIPEGGTPQYTYLWTTGHTTQTVQNIGTGTYYVTITDAMNNSVVKEVVLSAPQPITISGVITNATVTNGVQSANGAIDITFSGGTPEYLHYWTTNDGTGMVMGNFDQTNLTSGTYIFTVIDANNCTSSSMFGVGTISVAAPYVPNVPDLTIAGPVSIATSGIGQVYPNPSHGEVNIKSASETQRIEIYNANGTLIEKMDQLAEVEEIHSLDLRPGNYTVNFIKKDGTRTTERLIVR